MQATAAQAIVLGTAQFGLTYGVANKTGQLSRELAAETVAIARRGGISTLDTAIAYGQSESVLGAVGVGDMQVMTKLPPLPPGCVDVDGWVEGQVVGSLDRLRVSHLHGLSFHRPEQLLEGKGRELYGAARSLQARGIVEKIGISIYQPEDLQRLLVDYRFDMVQAPCSFFDRRMLASGWLDRLDKMGCELHARSVFLQGLLLMAASERPHHFQRWQALLGHWDAWLADVGLTALQASLRYVLSVPGIKKVVLGVDGPRQLEEILAAIDGPLPPVPGDLCSGDPQLLNPSLWPAA